MLGFLDRLALDRGLTILLCSVALALLCGELCFAVVRGKVQARHIVAYICKSIVAVAAAVLAGWLLSLLKLAGNWVYVAFYGVVLVAAVAAVLVYIFGEKRALRLATANSLRTSAGNTAAVRHAKGWMYGICVALSVAAALALAFGWRFDLIMFPVAVVAVSQLLHGILKWRIWFALAAIVIAAFAMFMVVDGVIVPQMASLPVIAGAALAAAFLVAALSDLAFRKE
ncbi:MAG: hypothetical protein IJS30_00480 [Bacteroidales bacterium]|nr:hypothetical protein [Bacteroidales bacterium]